MTEYIASSMLFIRHI